MSTGTEPSVQRNHATDKTLVSSLLTSRRPSSGPCNGDELLNTVIANAPIILWAVNHKGIFTVSEGRELQSLGLKPGEIVGKSVFDLYADYPDVLDDIRRAMAGEQFRHTIEVEDVIFDSWYSPIRNAKGELDGMIGVATNISEQMEAKKEKRLSDEIFATAFHSSPVAVVMTRLEDGVFLDANDGFLKMTGYERHEVIGRTAVDLNMWVDPLERQKMIDQIRSTGSIHGNEYKIRSRSGEIRIHRISVELVEFDGTPCLLTTGEDATERIQTEQSLQKSRERYSTLARVAPVGIFHTDADGNCLYVNEHWCTITGRNRDEALGSGWAKALHPEDRDWVFNQWQQTVKNQRPFQAEFRLQRPDGNPVWVIVQAEAEVDPLGEVASYVGSVTDISARKQAEEELHVLNEKLESRVAERTEEARQRQMELEHVSRVASVGHMASELAHEINQPLAAIANYAAGCSRRIKSGEFTTRELFETSEEISKQAKRASEFVRRVRNFVQKREVKMELANINEIVHEALAITKPEARKRNIKISLELGESLPAVTVDSIQIVHVLVNLFLNAFDAVEKLSSDNRIVAVGTDFSSGKSVIVLVKDNGTGVTPENFKKLFEPFHTTKLGGLGIGLSISRSIVETHRGQLWCTPNTTSETIFQFTLPLYAEEVTRAT